MLQNYFFVFPIFLILIFTESCFIYREIGLDLQAYDPIESNELIKSEEVCKSFLRNKRFWQVYRLFIGMSKKTMSVSGICMGTL